MKLLFALALPCAVLHAESPAPTKLEGAPRSRPGLISSDLNARELQFITGALDARNMLSFLARHASQSTNPSLRALGQEMEKALPGQTAILTTLAEMRQIDVPEQSPAQERLEKRLITLTGARRDKALLDALLDANQALVNTCEAGLKSSDKTVRQFAEQSLPYANGNLSRVQTMTGIAPRRTAIAAKEAARETAPEKAAGKPGFRTNLPPVGSNE